MRKQSRRRGERERGAEAAGRYLRRVGLPARPDGRPYGRMGEADPAWSARLSELDDRSVALAEAPSVDVAELARLTADKYSLIYRDLDTALAEYASRAVAVAGAWLPWWYANHRPVRRLLDVGCGAGVLTCAYALALPEAEVVGVDFVPEAVACAEELARRLGAGNATFVVADFTAAAPPAPTGAGGFDQVVAVTALGDSGLYPKRRPNQDPFSSVAEIDGPGLAYSAPGVSALATCAVPGGWLYVFDRTPDATQAAWLGAALLNAGVDLDLSLAGSLEVTEEGRPRTFTRFAGRRAASRRGTAGAQLGAWLKAASPPAYGPFWHDELRFERLKAAGATLAAGVEVDFAPHDPMVERREAWAHGNSAYGWTTNTMGLRELARAPSVEAAVAEVGVQARKWAAAGLRVRAYSGGRAKP